MRYQKVEVTVDETVSAEEYHSIIEADGGEFCQVEKNAAGNLRLPIEFPDGEVEYIHCPQAMPASRFRSWCRQFIEGKTGEVDHISYVSSRSEELVELAQPSGFVKTTQRKRWKS